MQLSTAQLLLPVRSIPPSTQQNTMQLSTAQYRREESRSLCDLPRRGIAEWGRRSKFIAYGFSFLIVSDVICYLFVLLTALAANYLIVYCSVLFFSSHFSFSSALPDRPNSLVAGLLPHSTITSKQIAGIFFPGMWRALSSTRSLNYNQSTRSDNPEYSNFPTPGLLHGWLS